MKESIETVRQFYNSSPEKEWARLSDRHSFEFILTTWMMDQYIRPGDPILDIGGGPGRYSIHYAGKSCGVTLVDLSKGNADFARRKAAEKNIPLTAYAGNCLELDGEKFSQWWGWRRNIWRSPSCWPFPNMPCISGGSRPNRSTQAI